VLRLLAVLFLISNPALAANLEFTEDLRIETAGTDEEFGQIRDVLVSDDGTLYVLDTGFGIIHAFDDDGQYLRSFGQTGEGPGDIPERILTVNLDRAGNLLLAGARSSISRIDGHGELVASIPLDLVPVPRSIFELPDGTIGLVYIPMNMEPGVPIIPEFVHLYTTEGEPVASFAESSWWSDEYPDRWARSILGASADTDPRNGEILLLQWNPFELRRYDATGQLINTVSNGLDGFSFPPSTPENSGAGETYYAGPGNSTRLNPTMSGDIFVGATRMHEGDRDRSKWDEPGFRIRWQQGLFVFGPDLQLKAERRIDDVPHIIATDHENRLWATDYDEEGIPFLVRYRYEITD